MSKLSGVIDIVNEIPTGDGTKAEHRKTVEGFEESVIVNV